MSPLVPRLPFAPVCKRRRNISSSFTQIAFIESPTTTTTTSSHSATSTTSTEIQPIDLAIIPYLLEQSSLTSSIIDEYSNLISKPNFSKCTYTLAARNYNFPNLLASLHPKQNQELIHQERNQQLASLKFKDKMGLFLSFCSVLVSIQMFVPRGI